VATGLPLNVILAMVWLRAETEQLYRAERDGTMPVVYREGRVAQLLLEQAPRLGERASYRTLRLVYLLANEPLGPEVPQLCLATVRDLPQLRDDASFVALLRATVDYAEKEPAQQQIYQQALQVVLKRD
jgi:hypothetical protein